MNVHDTSELPAYEEIRRLRAHNAELERELRRVRDSQRELLGETDVRYKEIFDNISVCMFLLDVTPDGRFKLAGFNPAEERAVGLSSESVRGKFIEDVFDPELARKLISNYRRCLKAGATITYDDELNLPAGRRHFHSNLIPIRNAAGQITGIVGACIDTTDFKRAQEHALASQKMESLGVLASGIAHDFNNLLGSVLAQTELAQTEIATGALPDEELTVIRNITVRAGEMLRELMIYSGQDEVNLGPVDLAALVEEMLGLLKMSISKHATLDIDLPRNLPPVLGNAVQIRQIVMNLITNASEALEERPGMISVRISRGESDELSRNGHFKTDRQFLRLAVADTGCGMTPLILERIFDPYFTTKNAGRGLGLAAVQRIIRQHEGLITAASTPGSGSRFEILLPCVTHAVPDTRAPEFNEVTDASLPFSATVLIVEDEEILRRAISKMLRKVGFSVIEAADGISGVDLFRANQSSIDVVLLDVTLPGLSGPEAFQEVMMTRPDTKVILTSAFSQHRAMSAIPDPRICGYIRKPYRTGDLVSMLRAACLSKAV